MVLQLPRRPLHPRVLHRRDVRQQKGVDRPAGGVPLPHQVRHKGARAQAARGACAGDAEPHVEAHCHRLHQRRLLDAGPRAPHPPRAAHGQRRRGRLSEAQRAACAHSRCFCFCACGSRCAGHCACRCGCAARCCGACRCACAACRACGARTACSSSSVVVSVVGRNSNSSSRDCRRRKAAPHGHSALCVHRDQLERAVLPEGRQAHNTAAGRRGGLVGGRAQRKARLGLVLLRRAGLVRASQVRCLRFFQNHPLYTHNLPSSSSIPQQQPPFVRFVMAPTHKKSSHLPLPFPKERKKERTNKACFPSSLFKRRSFFFFFFGRCLAPDVASSDVANAETDAGCVVELARKLDKVGGQLLFGVLVHPLAAACCRPIAELDQACCNAPRRHGCPGTQTFTDDALEMVCAERSLFLLSQLERFVACLFPGRERKPPVPGRVSKVLGVKVVVDAIAANEDEVAHVALIALHTQVADVWVPAGKVRAQTTTRIGRVGQVEPVVLGDVDHNAGLGAVVEDLAVAQRDAHKHKRHPARRILLLEKNAACERCRADLPAVFALADLVRRVCDRDQQEVSCGPRVGDLVVVVKDKLGKGQRRRGCSLERWRPPVAAVGNDCDHTPPDNVHSKAVTDGVANVDHVLVCRRDDRLGRFGSECLDGALGERIARKNFGKDRVAVTSLAAAELGSRKRKTRNHEPACNGNLLHGKPLVGRRLHPLSDRALGSVDLQQCCLGRTSRASRGSLDCACPARLLLLRRGRGRGHRCQLDCLAL